MRGFSKLLRRGQTEEEEQEQLQQSPLNADSDPALHINRGPALGEDVDLPAVDQSDDSDGGGPPNHPPPPPPGPDSPRQGKGLRRLKSA